MRLFLSAAMLLLALYWAIRETRRRLARKPEQRTRWLVGSWAYVIIGAILALWLPGRLPQTPGSPGTLVGMMLLWIVGGMMALLGIVGLVAIAWPLPSAGGTMADSE
jgi:hypothetical protein